jgi:hypothetical protein
MMNNFSGEVKNTPPYRFGSHRLEAGWQKHTEQGKKVVRQSTQRKIKGVCIKVLTRHPISCKIGFQFFNAVFAVFSSLVIPMNPLAVA